MLTDRLGLPAHRACSLTRTSAGTARVPGRASARRSRCRCASSTSPETPPSSACWAARSSPLRWCAACGRRLRSGHGGALADRAAEMLAIDADASAWAETLACEPGPRLTWRARPSTARWRRWVTSPTWPRRTWSATRPGSPSWLRLPPGDADSRPPTWRGPARGARPRSGTRRRAGPHLAEGRAAHAGRLGAGQAACVSHRARPGSLAVPRRARARRQLPPRAPGRLRLPPRSRRRRDHAARAPARRRRRLPRHDRAAAAPRGALAGQAAESSARRPAPGGWTPTPSAPCSRRPASASRGSSGRRV